MHRSGTSALTGVLQKLGVELGEELLPPSRDNQKGYFENAEVVAVQETLFAGLHRSWQDPRELPDGWPESAVADEAKEALAAVVEGMFTGNGDNLVAAVKDPRTSRVVPLWLDVATGVQARAGALLMLRHPNEVAGSLRKRDGLSRSRAHLLWMTYLLEAERASRGIPRAFVAYEALLADWRSELARMRKQGLVDALPTPTPAMERDIDNFLDASLRSHKAASDSGELQSPFEPLAVELYGLALRCALAPEEAGAEAQFDAIAQKLERVAARYLEGPLRMEEERQRQAQDQSRVDMSLQLAALRELWRPAFPSRAPGACRLYYREEGAQFVETQAVSAEPELTETGRRVTFELPAGAKVDYLRMDPDNAPGVYAVQSLVIDGVPVVDLADRIGRVSELSVPVNRVVDAVRFAALGEDPHFEMDARGLVQLEGAAGPWRIQVDFRTETVLSEVGGHLQDFRVGLEEGNRQLQGHQKRLAERAGSLEQQLEGFSASAGNISSRLETLDGTNRGLHAALEQKAQALRSALEDGNRSLHASFGDHRMALHKAVESGSQALRDGVADGNRALHSALAGESLSRHQEFLQLQDLLAGFGQALVEDRATTGEQLRAAQVQAEALARELEEIRGRQALLLNWARRRSPGYWWNRLLGRDCN